MLLRRRRCWSPRLADREILLILDNCEHVRQATADLAEALLRGSRRLRILATSRESLVAPGEVDYPVAPMELPPTNR